MTARELVESFAVNLALLVAFPRIARRRRSPRRVLGGVLLSTALTFVMGQWVVPRLRDYAEEIERTREALATRLGREPTDQEVVAEWRRR